MKHLLVLIALLFARHVFSQTVLLHENVSNLDFQMPSSGPNYKHFHQLYLNYRFLIPMNEDLEIKTITGKSGVFTVGWRYKRKISEWFAFGTGFYYENMQFALKQFDDKQFPDTRKHDKEKMIYNTLNLELYIRFNFGQRGNIIGKFIDLGAYGGYAVGVKHNFTDNSDKNILPYSGKIKVNEKDLDYVNRLNYGVQVRMGINRWVITASYRLNDLIADNYKATYDDNFLPKLAVGVEIGLHK